VEEGADFEPHGCCCFIDLAVLLLEVSSVYILVGRPTGTQPQRAIRKKMWGKQAVASVFCTIKWLTMYDINTLYTVKRF
jgi:hypothetical protein